MSENNQDNNQDIIESEIIETPESIEDNKTVVIKKGGFFSFLSFILAASALTACAYLYVQLQKSTDNPVVNNWQQPLADIDKKTDEKYLQLSNQIKNIQKTNGELQKQLKTIESIAANIKPANNSATTITYDDSELLQRMQALKNQLDNQIKSLEQIRTTLKNTTNKHNQAIEQINQELSNAGNQTSGVTLINRNYQYELAEHFLKAANEQFGIYGNVIKGKEFLIKTQNQLSSLEGEDYQLLAREIKNVSDELLNNPPIDVVQLNKQIDQLADESRQLKLNQVKSDEKKEQEQSSWYDKLIVIRKVDANSDSKLTISEQQNLHNDLDNHFSLLKIALMGNKQASWQEEISAIESILNEFFPSQANNIKQQLLELKALDINPKLPDLTQYLDSLQALNSSEFSEAEVPFETHMITDPTNKTHQNQ